MADGVSMYDKPARGDNVELAGGTRFGDVISAPIGRVLVLLESGIFADVVSESVVPGRDLADILDLTVYLLRQLDEDVEIKRSKSFDIEL